MMKALRPELELLLLCASTRTSAKRTLRIQQLFEEALDWDYLLGVAFRHGLSPLLYWRLSAISQVEIPLPHLQMLRKHFQENIAHNLFLTQELHRITGLFETNGIKTIAYKGPALAALAYNDLRLRGFTDLDIIVRKRDVARAKEILLEQSYVLWPELTGTQQDIVLRKQHCLAFKSAELRIVVELHWKLAGRRFADPLEAEQMWKDLKPVSAGGHTVMTLSLENLLLALCVHGSRHLWERLAWVCDIAELLAAHDQIDWRVVINQAALSGTRRMLFLGLHLTSELFDAKLPDEIREGIKADPIISVLAEFIVNQIFIEPDAATSNLKGFLFQVKSRERLRDKIRYCGFALSPTDADVAAISFPRYAGFLYYLLRPIRLVQQQQVKSQAVRKSPSVV
jgi:Uncharacterised nucleotidyltransferase